MLNTLRKIFGGGEPKEDAGYIMIRVEQPEGRLMINLLPTSLPTSVVYTALLTLTLDIWANYFSDKEPMQDFLGRTQVLAEALLKEKKERVYH
jgi:hypothetical protein